MGRRRERKWRFGCVRLYLHLNSGREHGRKRGGGVLSVEWGGQRDGGCHHVCQNLHCHCQHHLCGEHKRTAHLLERCGRGHLHLGGDEWVHPHLDQHHHLSSVFSLHGGILRRERWVQRPLARVRHERVPHPFCDGRIGQPVQPPLREGRLRPQCCAHFGRIGPVRAGRHDAESELSRCVPLPQRELGVGRGIGGAQQRYSHVPLRCQRLCICSGDVIDRREQRSQLHPHFGQHHCGVL
mmetsp:Transcript_23227/g.58885  ORF Transcript_23227/g.58885 Transcript_23227/m.58885 type:complete len:239 (-) Transcript_23227:627-1343(-)